MTWLPLVLFLSWGLFLDSAKIAVDFKIPDLPQNLGKTPALIVRELAIDNGALGCLLKYVLPTDDKKAIWDEEADRIQVPIWAREEWPQVQDDQRWIVLTEVQELVRALVTSRPNIITNLRKNEMDGRQSGLRGHYTRSTREQKEMPQNFPVFMELVIALYNELPADSDPTLWNEPALLSSLSEGKDIEQQIMLARTLLAIANGPSGSRSLEDVLTGSFQNGVSFNIEHIFEGMLNITERLRPLQGEDQQRNSTATQMAAIPLPPPTPLEFERLRVHCLLLVRILKWTPGLALKILDSMSISPISLMWQLVNRPLPSPTKAAVLDTLAAFCKAGIEESKFEICAVVWFEMEKICLGLPKDPQAGPLKPGSVRTVRGIWLTRLEDQDKEDDGYDARQALIRLFAYMIKGDRPSLAAPESLAIDTALRRSIVEYTLVDTGMAIGALAYMQSSPSALRTVESVAMFVDFCIAAFDPDSAILQPGSKSGQVSVLAGCVRQAGYHLMEIFLTNRNVFDLITYGAGLGQERISQFDYTLERCIVQTTQYFLRALIALTRSQRPYLEVLLPSVRIDKQVSTQLDLKPPPMPVAADRQLVNQMERVVNIATYTTEGVDSALALLAVEFLSEIAQTDAFQGTSNAGNTTGTILVQAAMASRWSQVILNGMVYRLDASQDAVTPNSYDPSHARFANDLTPLQSRSDSTKACQQAVMDFLLNSLQNSSLGPNLAHYLLGFLVGTSCGPQMVKTLHREGSALEAQEEMVVKDHSKMPRTCLHVLVDRLLRGIPMGDGDEVDESTFSWITEPDLAGRALHLVNLLCATPWTSHMTIRYMRGQEDLVIRLIGAFSPFAQPENSRVKADERSQVTYHDRPSMAVSSRNFVRLLQVQSSLYDLAAFDMYSSLSGEPYTKRLVHLLLRGTQSHGEDNDGFNGNNHSSLLIEALDAMDVDFSFAGDVTKPQGTFGSFDYESCRHDEAGVMVYDVSTIETALRAQANSHLRPNGSPSELQEEIRVVCDLIKRSNAEARVNHAAATTLSSWATLAVSVVTKVSPDSALDGTSVFNLGQHSLDYLSKPSSFALAKADYLSDLCMLISSSLVGWTPSTASKVEQGQYMLPLEYVVDALQHTIGLILDDGTNENSRGALYTSMMDYLKIGWKWVDDDDGSESWEAIWRTVEHIQDRLVRIVARDALNGLDVWKTVSYTLLTRLLELSGSHAAKVVEILDKNGYLQSMAYSLQTTDKEITAAIWSEDRSRSIIVYDAKMDFLLRLIACEGGGLRMARSGILHLLGQCAFIGSRPDMHDAEMDAAEESARALSTYLGLISPALRLMLRMLQTDYQSCYQGVIDFIANQTDSLLAMLGDVAGSLSPERLEPLLLATSILDEVNLVSDIKLQASRPKMAQMAIAIKALPSRFWSRARWEPLLDPMTPDEVEASAATDGESSLVRFGVAMHR